MTNSYKELLKKEIRRISGEINDKKSAIGSISHDAKELELAVDQLYMRSAINTPKKKNVLLKKAEELGNDINLECMEAFVLCVRTVFETQKIEILQQQLRLTEENMEKCKNTLQRIYTLYYFVRLECLSKILRIIQKNESNLDEIDGYLKQGEQCCEMVKKVNRGYFEKYHLTLAVADLYHFIFEETVMLSGQNQKVRDWYNRGYELAKTVSAEEIHSYSPNWEKCEFAQNGFEGEAALIRGMKSADGQKRKDEISKGIDEVLAAAKEGCTGWDRFYLEKWLEKLLASKYICTDEQMESLEQAINEGRLSILDFAALKKDFLEKKKEERKRARDARYKKNIEIAEAYYAEKEHYLTLSEFPNLELYYKEYEAGLVEIAREYIDRCLKEDESYQISEKQLRNILEHYFDENREQIAKKDRKVFWRSRGHQAYDKGISIYLQKLPEAMELKSVGYPDCDQDDFLIRAKKLLSNGKIELAIIHTMMDNNIYEEAEVLEVIEGYAKDIEACFTEAKDRALVKQREEARRLEEEKKKQNVKKKKEKPKRRVWRRSEKKPN